MLGKYSPTISGWYSKDQNWFEKNGGGFDNGYNPNSDLDNDGYDSYGYTSSDSFEDYDREGFYERDYWSNKGEERYEQIERIWWRKPLPYEK
ncbi:hypothetical protein PBI_SCTP2_350 [Salicola phage SCTP-2]|nr:hypothetical protein PBI_SCTP2_350 [Salicola phage SCTP-2]